MEQLIETTHSGECIGPTERMDCHIEEGILHRAFSIILIDELGRICLQRRSAKKMLWPLAWSNSCCSHPHWGEHAQDAVARRIPEELGCHANNLQELFTFSYEASYSDIGRERELCGVWIGRVRADALAPNPDEIAAVAFLEASDVTRALSTAPALFTPWFSIQWPVVLSHLIGMDIVNREAATKSSLSVTQLTNIAQAIPDCNNSLVS